MTVKNLSIIINKLCHHCCGTGAEDQKRRSPTHTLFVLFLYTYGNIEHARFTASLKITFVWPHSSSASAFKILEDFISMYIKQSF